MKVDESVFKIIISRYKRFYKASNVNLHKREEENYARLQEFYNRYNLEKIQGMTLEQYCFEAGNPNTFCYWVENTLNDLGDIHINGQCGYQKFHIQKINGEYVFKRRNQQKNWAGETADEVYSTIHPLLVGLISAIENNNTQGILSSRIYEVFKAKLTYLYNPSKWVPIYAKPDVNKILSILRVPFRENESLTKKRVLLYEYYLKLKKQIDDITTWRFMNLFYDSNGLRECIRGTGVFDVSLANASAHNNVLNSPEPSIDQIIKSAVLEDGFSTLDDSYSEDDRTINNFDENEKSSKEKRIIGEKGERLVLNYLEKHKSELGIVSITPHGLLKQHNMHRDFTCTKNDGSEFYIEVKSTSANRWPNVYLEMSEMGYKFMNRHMDSYFFYILDDIFNTEIIHIIKAEELITKLKPCKYKLNCKKGN